MSSVWRSIPKQEDLKIDLTIKVFTTSDTSASNSQQTRSTVSKVPAQYSCCQAKSDPTMMLPSPQDTEENPKINLVVKQLLWAGLGGKFLAIHAHKLI